MNDETLKSIASWLLTIALHGGTFLLAAWTIDRVWRLPQSTWRELMWRVALFGGVITASMQMMVSTSPFAENVRLSVDTTSTPATADPARSVPVIRAHPSTTGKSSSAEVRTGQISSPFVAPVPQTSRSQMLSLPALIIGIWLMGALFGLARIGRSLFRLRHALRNIVELPVDDRAHRDVAHHVAALAKRASVREPRLYSLADIASPIAVIGNRIIVPSWAIQSLDSDQLRAMFAHEFAHIVRLDPQWKLLSGFWRALFWFLPLVNVAQRRLAELAELACDGFAARRTGNARSVAECLAACVEHQMRTSTYDLAPAMAGRDSPLMHRIECLLEGVSMENFAPSLRVRAFAAMILAAAALTLPAITFFSPHVARAAETVQKDQASVKPIAAKHDSDTNSSISIHDDDGDQKTSIRISDLDHQLSVKVSGKIAFNGDETDVISLSAGGTAAFEETRAGVTRRAEFTERAGKTERRYFVDQHEQPFDAAAGAWLATLLPAVARESGIGAEARVQRIYAAGGAKKVLDEIALIYSDYVRGIYLRLLIDRGQLAPADLERTLNLVGEIGSDYERHQVMDEIFAKQTLSAAQQVAFLKVTADFSSDYERAELLIYVAPKMNNSADVHKAWLDAALGLSSDYDRRRTLQAMLTGNGFDDAQLGSVIEASDSMGSDYERRELLIEIIRHAHDIDALAPAFARSTEGMGSDYERREALLALINAGKLGPNGTKAVLDSAAQMGSDYECREVLVALARVMPNDATSIERYRQVAQHLSDSERSEAEGALKR